MKIFQPTIDLSNFFSLSTCFKNSYFYDNFQPRYAYTLYAYKKSVDKVAVGLFIGICVLFTTPRHCEKACILWNCSTISWTFYSVLGICIYFGAKWTDIAFVTSFITIETVVFRIPDALATFLIQPSSDK